jgi:O-antigen/teichoic acid export membrane protein
MPFAGLVLFTTAMNSEWILQATGRLGAIGFWRFASQVVYFLIVPFVVVGAAQRGAVHFALATVGGYAVIAVGTTVMAASRFAEWPRPTLRALGVRIKRSAATGYAMAMIQIYYYLDSVMLAYLADRRVVGVYGVAYRLPLAFIAISQMWVGALMPHAAALNKTDRKRLRADLGKILEGAIVLAVAVTVLSAAVAHDLMTSLFGNQFGGAGAPFALLMAAAGVVVVSTSVVPVVVAISGGRMFAVATTAAAAVNVALNFALIPIYGAAGAALATFAAEAAVLAVMWIPLRRAVGPLTIGWPFVIRQSSVVAGSGIALGIALRLHLGWISLPFGTVALCGVALAVAAVGRRVRGSEV